MSTVEREVRPLPLPFPRPPLPGDDELPKRDEAGELLERAADWLEAHEWITGQMFRRRMLGDGFAGACLAGALLISDGASDYDEAVAMCRELPSKARLEATRRLIETLRRRNSHYGDAGPIWWNDSAARNKGEVIRLLREAAAS